MHGAFGDPEGASRNKRRPKMTRTSIFTTFGLTLTAGKFRFHSSNTSSKGGETYANMLRKDGRNQPHVIVSPVGYTRCAGASWFLATAQGLTPEAKKFLKSVIASGAPVTRVHGFGNGKWANGQAIAAKRA
jgi:hypothetical protein